MKSPIFSGLRNRLKGWSKLVLIRRVAGASMLPTLRAGQIIVAIGSAYTAGDIVIIRHDGVDKIKRIFEIRRLDDQAEIFVVGDNLAESTDSRHFGWIPQTAVVAKLIWPRLTHTLTLPNAQISN